LQADSSLVLQRLRLADLDFLSRLYAAHELRLQNRVSMDLPDVLSGVAEAPALRDGDQLRIPRDEETVLVFGAVNDPGYVSFGDGDLVEAYLDKAGGPDSNAGAAYVIRAASGASVPAAGVHINSGDVIFVDRLEDRASTPGAQQLVLQKEQLDLQEQNARRDARFRVIQAVLGTVGTIGSVVALIISVRNR
jgi:hypothetical protein